MLTEVLPWLALNFLKSLNVTSICLCPGSLCISVMAWLQCSNSLQFCLAFTSCLRTASRSATVETLGPLQDVPGHVHSHVHMDVAFYISRHMSELFQNSSIDISSFSFKFYGKALICSKWYCCPRQFLSANNFHWYFLLLFFDNNFVDHLFL